VRETRGGEDAGCARRRARGARRSGPFGLPLRSGLQMSRRGRATIALLVTLVAFGTGFVLQISLDLVSALRVRTPSSLHEAGSQPAVSARRSRSRSQDPPPAVPKDLIARLPVDASRQAAVVARGGRRWVESVVLSPGGGAYEIEYSFDIELTRRILQVLDRGRVNRGHVIVLDPRSGRVLAYVSTDPERFPPGDSYPAASLIKVVTAAAALDHVPEKARRPCLYRGNQYRLNRSRVHRPTRGNPASLERALATSNNQCFAQLAVDAIGSENLIDTIERFGWLDVPAPGHHAGQLEPVRDDYELGKLGCGLSGCRITPLHAAQLAATLATGEQVTPWWVDQLTDPSGRELRVPRPAPPRRVIGDDLAAELRSMLVRTTTHGTARSAFRDARGRPRLRGVRVAGKTGNLSGKQPKGRYEWFIGAAPAAEPSIALAVLQLHSNLWWSKSSEIAADVLEAIFCERGRCEAALAARYTGDLGDRATPILLSDQR